MSPTSTVASNNSTSKKRKRSKASREEPTTFTESASMPAETAIDASSSSKKTKTTATTESTDIMSKKSRFIVFIGNLPYTTNTDALSAHFKAVSPTSIRLITEKPTDANSKKPPRCKGFAFLEFERYDRMKLCLEKFHHSIFQDGNGEGRKINVELT
jgi:nucleolar protein 6